MTLLYLKVVLLRQGSRPVSACLRVELAAVLGVGDGRWLGSLLCAETASSSGSALNKCTHIGLQLTSDHRYMFAF